MSNTTHTPGPWTAQLENGGHASLVTGHEGYSICAVSFQDPQREGGRSYAEEHANAKLIAASPELLEALKLLAYGAEAAVNAGLVNPQVNGGLILARAAIAKATA